MHKSSTVRGEWAKVGTDIRDQDILTILDAGVMNPSSFGDGEQPVFRIQTTNGERILSLNKGSSNNLINAFGDESTNWVNKRVKAWVVRMMVAGSMKNVVFLAHPDWTMDDNGMFVNPDAGADAEYNKMAAGAAMESERHMADDIPFDETSAGR